MPVRGFGQKNVDFWGSCSRRSITDRILAAVVGGRNSAASARPSRTASSAFTASGVNARSVVSAVEHQAVKGRHRGRLAFQPAHAVDELAAFHGGRAEDHGLVVHLVQHLLQVPDPGSIHGRSAGAHDPVVGQDRRVLRDRVHEQHHGSVPRSGPVGGTHLVSKGQGHGVPVVAVGDQHRFPGQFRPHALLVVGHPQAMRDPFLVQDLRERFGLPRSLQQGGERWRRLEEHGVDAREVGPDLPDEPEAVLHRAMGRPFVRDDRASPLLQLHGTDQPTDPSAPAMQGEAHLVREVGRSRRRDQDALGTPRPELVGGPPILVAGPVVSRTVLAEVDPNDVVGARMQVPALLLGRDRVVGRSGDPVQRTDPGSIEEQADER